MAFQKICICVFTDQRKISTKGTQIRFVGLGLDSNHHPQHTFVPILTRDRYYTMKSTDALPSIPTSAATIRLQQERQRRRLALPNHHEVAATTEESSASSPATSTSNNMNPRMMAMKPIILSRKRRPGSGGVFDRKKLAELLDEALSISMKFDGDSNRHRSSTNDDDDETNMTLKK